MRFYLEPNTQSELRHLNYLPSNVFSVIEQKADFEEFKNHIRYQKALIDIEIKEQEHSFSVYSSEQHNLCHEDHQESIQKLNDKKMTLQRECVNYQKKYKRGFHLLNESEKSQFKAAIMALSTQRIDSFYLSGKLIKSFSKDLVDILIYFYSDKISYTLRHFVENNLNIKMSVFDNFTGKKNLYFVDKDLVKKRALFYKDGHPKNTLECNRDKLLQMPLSQLMDLLKPIIEVRNALSSYVVTDESQITKNENKKNEFHKFFNSIHKVDFILNQYELLKLNNLNYEKIVLK
ncbi:MAG: hypothetical protein CL760_05885 [Chloroflexi bacterium]|nr:hypothetical protein [Chloroflexota bacterium]